MGELALGWAKLAVVQDYTSDGDSCIIRFSDGTTRNLPKGGTKYERWLQLIEKSRRKGYPLGLSSGSSGVIDRIQSADNDVVEEIRDEPLGMSRVVLRGHDGIFSLPADVPDRTRILDVLQSSARANSRVWFLAELRTLSIWDACPVSATTGEDNAPGVVASPSAGSVSDLLTPGQI